MPHFKLHTDVKVSVNFGDEMRDQSLMKPIHTPSRVENINVVGFQL